MIWIYDRDENQIDFLDLNPVFTRELNSINTLEFSSDKEYKKGYRVVYKLDDRFYEFIITEINYSRSDYYTFSYYCEDSIIELRYTIIEDKRPEGDIWTALKVVLEDTRFDYKVINSKDIRHKNSYYRETALKCFLDTVEKYNVDWYTNFSVSNFGVLKREIIIEDRGKITGYRLEFGKNIRTFTREIINEDIITALYGFGKGEEILDENGDSTGGYGRRIDFASINNGKKYVENLEAKARYGIGKKENKSHNYGVVIFEDITDRTELLKATQEELDRVSKVQAEYNVDFLELEEELYNLQIDIGDKVQVIDREINFRDELRVIKIVQENKRKNYTFGNLVKPMSENSVSKITKVEDDLENYVSDFSSSFINVSKKIKENKDYYDSKINDINQEIVDYTNNLSQEIKNAPEVTIEWLKENTGVLPSGVLALDGGLKAGHIEAGAIKTIHHESKSITSELVKFDQAFIDEITSRVVISELGMFGKIIGKNFYLDLDLGNIVMGDKLRFIDGELYIDLKGQQAIEDAIKEGLNNLKIGSRNLYVNSSWKDPYISNQEVVEEDLGDKVALNLPTGYTYIYSHDRKRFDEGDYVLSYSHKGPSITPDNKIFVSDSPAENTHMKFLKREHLGDGWYRSSYTFHLDGYFEDATLLIGFDLVEEMVIHSVKIEKGTIPTDWDMAPEDLNFEDRLEIISERIDDTHEILADKQVDNEKRLEFLEEFSRDLNISLDDLEENTITIDERVSGLEFNNETLELSFEYLKGEVGLTGVELEKLTSIITSGMTENGDPYTEWRAGKGAIVRVGTDAIIMETGGNETFRVEDGAVKTSSLYVESEIGFGNHTARKHGTRFTIFNYTGG